MVLCALFRGFLSSFIHVYSNTTYAYRADCFNCLKCAFIKDDQYDGIDGLWYYFPGTLSPRTSASTFDTYLGLRNQNGLVRVGTNL